MSPWRRTAQLIGLDVPHWNAHALDYLEAQGFRFCIDFGTENALALARDHWAMRKRRRG